MIVSYRDLMQSEKTATTCTRFYDQNCTYTIIGNTVIEMTEAEWHKVLAKSAREAIKQQPYF